MFDIKKENKFDKTKQISIIVPIKLVNNLTAAKLRIKFSFQQ